MTLGLPGLAHSVARLQHLDDVVEIVGPQAPTCVRLDRFRHLVDSLDFERVFAVGEQDPVAAAPHRFLAVVSDEHSVESLRVGELLDDGGEIEIAVGDVEGDDPARLNVPAIDRQCLGGDEVNGYRVAGEGIDRQHIEVLGRLALQIQPRIAERDLDGRVALADEAEVTLGDADHRGVDVVEAVDVTLGAVGRDRSGAEPDDADLQRPKRRVHRLQYAPDAGSLRVVARRTPLERGSWILRAVQDGAVDERPVVVGGTGVPLLDTQNAVEVARGQHRVLVEVVKAPSGGADREQQRRRGKPDEYEVHAPDLEHEQTGAGDKPERELEIRRQDEWCNQTNQCRADRAAERYHQVEAGQVARRGLESRELAVAEHAGEEQAGAEYADLQLQLVGEIAVGKRPAHRAQPRSEHGEENLGAIPARAVEAEDEGEQVDRERRDP